MPASTRFELRGQVRCGRPACRTTLAALAGPVRRQMLTPGCLPKGAYFSSNPWRASPRYSRSKHPAVSILEPVSILTRHPAAPVSILASARHPTPCVPCTQPARVLKMVAGTHANRVPDKRRRAGEAETTRQPCRRGRLLAPTN